MKNRVLLVLVLASLGAGVACTSETSPAGAGSTSREDNPSDPEAEDGAPDAGESPDPKAPSPDGGPSDTGTPSGPAAFTKAEAQALVDQRCVTCHFEAPSNWSGDFLAATVGVPSAQVPAMALITKGDRKKSYFFHKIAGTHAAAGGSGARMPKGKPALSATEIERLGKLIDTL